MTEIPDDVMEAAEAAYSDAVRGAHDTRSFESRIEVIARAILEERERCAKVAHRNLCLYQELRIRTVSEIEGNH